MSRGPDDQGLYERSGQRKASSKLVSFLYELLRDDVTAGHMEHVLRQSNAGDSLTNGFLALFAEDVAARLLETP